MSERQLVIRINKKDVLDLISLVNGIESAYVLANDDVAETEEGTIRIHCVTCAKVVSTPVPVGTIVRAWVQCPECIETEYHVRHSRQKNKQENSRRRWRLRTG